MEPFSAPSPYLPISTREVVEILVSNAADAIHERLNREEKFEPAIAVHFNGKELAVRDNGVGFPIFDPDLAQELGRSTRRDALDFAVPGYYGRAGLGLAKLFSVSETVRIYSGHRRLIMYPDNTWKIFEDQPHTEGTVVAIDLSDYNIEEHLDRFEYLPYSVSLQMSTSPEVDIRLVPMPQVEPKGPAPWVKPRDRARLELSCFEHFGVMPVRTIPLEIEEFNFEGMAYLVAIRDKEGANRPQARLYYNDLLVSEDVPGLLEPWMTFVRVEGSYTGHKGLPAWVAAELRAKIRDTITNALHQLALKPENKIDYLVDAIGIELFRAAPYVPSFGAELRRSIVRETTTGVEPEGEGPSVYATDWEEFAQLMPVYQDRDERMILVTEWERDILERLDVIDDPSLFGKPKKRPTDIGERVSPHLPLFYFQAGPKGVPFLKLQDALWINTDRPETKQLQELVAQHRAAPNIHSLKHLLKVIRHLLLSI